ncbi:DUF6431 domain-containing protein [Clostridium boliviensis]|uniref:DUF6431 domain-containing protein n=1 Tax=Clostridium boliviensis TaxID=318465 RepID=A0ABU4GPX5_9CLOT|nr:DUF6431 domain-containing protein [Clostridium boliviensis]MDW2799651.1 DUF6431 domain-containing protein [Clostridium boliviensis]
MITVFTDFCNPISQDFYDKTIAKVQFHQLTCTCGHSGGLTIHGYYYRSIKSEESVIRLHICRVKCSYCGTTHALLLSSIVPYSQTSLFDQVRIISCYEDSGDFSAIMNQTPSIDENIIRSVIRRYFQHWMQRLLSAGISFDPAFFFIRRCFSFFKRQFMQIKITPNILFLRPT